MIFHLRESKEAWWIIDQKARGSIVGHQNEVVPRPPPGMDVQKIFGKGIVNPPPLLGYPSETLVLYHGTSLQGVEGIRKEGFRKPRCKKPKECEQSCTCHMMGKCFYFAGFDKALRHAKQSSFWEKRAKGAVLRVAIQPGKWRVQPKTPCGCPCKKPYVDHLGQWMTHYDSIFLQDNSLPAVRTSEWCVKSPDQIRLIDARRFFFVLDD